MSDAHFLRRHWNWPPHRQNRVLAKNLQDVRARDRIRLLNLYPHKRILNFEAMQTRAQVEHRAL
jgi:hypothetical protein